MLLTERKTSVEPCFQLRVSELRLPVMGTLRVGVRSSMRFLAKMSVTGHVTVPVTAFGGVSVFPGLLFRDYSENFGVHARALPIP